MIALGRTRLALVRSSYILQPRVHTRFSHSSSKGTTSRRWVATSIALSPALLASCILTQTPDPQDRARPLEERSTPSLLRSYLVYSLCSWPSLVEASPRIIDWALQTKLPGVSWFAERLIMATFFNQFAGGETLETSRPIVESLATRNIATLFAYSVEADQSSIASLSQGHKTLDGHSRSNADGLHRDMCDETLRAIDFAANMNQTKSTATAVAIKLSGLLKDPAVLVRLSSALLPRRDFTNASHSALVIWNRLQTVILSEADARAVQSLLSVMRTAAIKAKVGKVKLIIDAEQSWLQPAIDVLFLELARGDRRREEPARRMPWWSAMTLTSSNRLPQLPTFYMTLQASLRRSEAFLEALLHDSAKHQWPLGIKVVRGAYVEQEHAVTQVGGESAAWPNKMLTDECYNRCAARLVGQVSNSISRAGQQGRTGPIAVFFASHNRQSIKGIFDQLQQHGLAKKEGSTNSPLIIVPEAASRLCFGQLYGMADDLTDELAVTVKTPASSQIAAPAPFLYKYIPYGPLKEVLPYLVRRAQENKSMLRGAGREGGSGGAEGEKKIVWNEMKRRVSIWLG